MAHAEPPRLPPPGGEAQGDQAAQGGAGASSGALGDGAAANAGDPRPGLVVVEQGGRVLGMGTVLGGDGRVLTSLSALSGAEQASLRYADGSVVKARLGHRDTAWDLALLIPQSGRWTTGLRASETDPESVEIRTFVAAKPKPSVVYAKVRGRTFARGLAKEGRGEALERALDVEVRGAPAAGAPLVDATGTVLGVLVHACKGQSDKAVAGAPSGPPCAPTLVGAPVTAVRAFLGRTPANAVVPSPFLGIVGESEGAESPVRGVRVVAVAPASPAEKGALKPNADIIVAVDGALVDAPERLAEIISKHAVGDAVKLLVYGGDKLREVQVTLRATP